MTNVNDLYHETYSLLYILYLSNYCRPHCKLIGQAVSRKHHVIFTIIVTNDSVCVCGYM